MKESSWNECLISNSSIRVSVDLGKVKSLLEIAQERIEFSAREIDSKNGNFISEDYYSSILEVMHVVVLLDGFKVSNHTCLGYYLRDILKKEDLYRLFDDCRFKRNSLVYYGKRMDFETLKDSLVKAKSLFNSLNNLVKERLNA